MKPFTYRQLSDRERKNLAILNLVRKTGAISRAEISEKLDINLVSVSNYIKSFIEHHLVSERGFEPSTGGRRAELVEVNKRGSYVLGVELNDKYFRITLADIALNILKKSAASYYSETVTVGKVIESLLEEAGIEPAYIRAVGAGIEHGISLERAEELTRGIGHEIYYTTSATCVAAGEHVSGQHNGTHDFLYMHSDLGCGIVIRDDIYLGSSGNAGGTEPPSNGANAVAEGGSRYLKPWGIKLGLVDAARRSIERGVGTKLVGLANGDINNITIDMIMRAASDGDEVALSIVQDAISNLAVRVAYLVNLFNPSLVILGGGLEKAGPNILKDIGDLVKRFAVKEQATAVSIVASTLGDDGVSFGAAALAVREIFLKA